MDNWLEFRRLSLESLQPLISTKWVGRSVLLFNQLESTNTYALHLAERGIPHGTVVLAECQTGGKGRFSRQWHSPANLNIYFSLILTQLPSQPFISWIPLATAIAMAETIEEVAKLKISLKWPNDLLFDTKKLGGILCESTTKGPSGRAVIVGVGININCREHHFPQKLKDIATSLAILGGRPFDRHTLLSIFFSRFEFYYERAMHSDLPILQTNYVSRCATLGRHIQVRLSGNKLLEGIALNIGNEGELHLMPKITFGDSTHTHPSTVSVRAGDVIHVR